MSEERYFCTECGRTHKVNSKIGQEHLQYRRDIPVEEDTGVETDQAPEELPESKPEGGIGRLTIGGPAPGSPPTPPNRGIPVLQKEEDTFDKLAALEGDPELCKYLYWARDSCADCRGHRCAAAGDKKLAPSLIEDTCKTEEHRECKYFLDALKTNMPAICPYQGPPPPEKLQSCSGVWCYADNRNVRVPKSCRKFWVNCMTFARAKWAGKPFYRDLPREVVE